MRSQHRTSISVPIPSNLPPEFVLDLIQQYTPTLQHNTVIADFTEIPSDVNKILSDPFFGPPDDSLRTFRIHEVITLVPGLKREMYWPTTFQRTPNGIRSRADANAGMVVWAEWIVRPRQDPTASAGSTPSTEHTLGEEWELYEEVVMEANSLLMPFASRVSDSVHRDITRKLVEQAMKSYTSQIP